MEEDRKGRRRWGKVFMRRVRKSFVMELWIVAQEKEGI
jgi:hypothetical protein